jgi:hypothetical protein
MLTGQLEPGMPFWNRIGMRYKTVAYGVVVNEITGCVCDLCHWEIV